MRLILALLAASALFMAGGCAKEKTTDLAQEMAAQKEVMKIKTLFEEGKYGLVNKKLIELEKRFGHTQTYAEAKKGLLGAGFSTESQQVAFTGKRMMELENLMLSYRKETGEWPDPGMIAKPLDAWDNELYWIVAEPGKSYELLIISSGLDGKAGTGDELIVVWIKRSHKNKQLKKGEEKGEGTLSKKKLNKSKSVVMTIDDLLILASESGESADRSMTLKQLQTAGEVSKKAGQPRRGETIMSLEEIKTKF